MSISHTINVSDLADRDALHRAILEIQNNGVSYALVQDGVEVAKVIPTEERYDKNDKVSDELTKKKPLYQNLWVNFGSGSLPRA